MHRQNLSVANFVCQFYSFLSLRAHSYGGIDSTFAKNLVDGIVRKHFEPCFLRKAYFRRYDCVVIASSSCASRFIGVPPIVLMLSLSKLLDDF